MPTAAQADRRGLEGRAGQPAPAGRVMGRVPTVSENHAIPIAYSIAPLEIRAVREPTERSRENAPAPELALRLGRFLPCATETPTRRAAVSRAFTRIFCP